MPLFQRIERGPLYMWKTELIRTAIIFHYAFFDSHLQSIIERIPSAYRETGFWFSMIHSRDHWYGFTLFYFMIFYGEHIIDSTNKIELMRCSIIGNTIAPMKDKRTRNEAITQGG